MGDSWMNFAGIPSGMSNSVMWFRRDLRIADNPALLESLKSDGTVPLFVLDPNVLKPSGDARIAFLFDCLDKLNESLDGSLVIRHGDPARVVSATAREVEADSVFCAEDFGPYGRQRDDDVEATLAKHDITLERVDSNYAVEPGSVVKKDGTPFQVFTPFSRAWQEHGWGSPRSAPRNPSFISLQSDGLPESPKVDAELPPPGEAAARKRLNAFLDSRVNGYKDGRDFPAAGATSRLSPYLKYGCIHPRQVLDKLGAGVGAATFRTEICWREFYADVLFHRPETLTTSYQPKFAKMKVDGGKRAEERFDAWAKGETGYPIVDAGMRQLLGEAWMHNRVRMIVASFLVKDLHVDWTWGARHFMQHLVDGDIASNTHGWQWTAGNGTDASPFFRIFNPTTQGKKFDPDGEYVRKWVPELRDVDKKYIHEPWKHPDGVPEGYMAPMVDHDEERKDALARYAAL
jgi:deoxyribodipyrimidine photo-lyase